MLYCEQSSYLLILQLSKYADEPFLRRVKINLKHVSWEFTSELWISIILVFRSIPTDSLLIQHALLGQQRRRMNASGLFVINIIMTILVNEM